MLRKALGLAVGAAAGALLLAGCQAADPLPADTVLRLKLNDSLSKYDSVVITILDRADSNLVLEKIWAAPLPAPSQLPGFKLTKAKDRDFILRVAGYASLGQVRMTTLIYYLGGNTSVRHEKPEPYRPINYLVGLSSSSGKLSPAFKPDSLVYRVLVPEGVKLVTLSLQPAVPFALLSVDGIPVAAGKPSQGISIGSTPDTVQVLVTDASEGAAYTRQYQVILNPTLPPQVLLSSLIPSVGTLNPPFQPDITVYSLAIPAEADHVSFVMHPTDPQSMTMLFMGGSIFDGEQSRPVEIGPGGSNVADMEVFRGGSHTYYQVSIDRPNKP